ncbi:MAG: alpha/beta hydrolase [Bacteroidales bacterium]|nr:alpha/beta hydrolase [Bacteroidales bacterium]
MSIIVKKILKWFLAVLAVFCFLMLIPRIISLVLPGSPPVGYHFYLLDYLAIKAGLEDTITKKPIVPADIEVIPDVEYKVVDGKSLQIDFYRPRNKEGKLPLLVFIHGGGWSGGRRSDYLVYLIPFAQKGYMTATVSYTLKDKGNYPQCVEDITDALQWFFNNGDKYGYDPGRIALVGGSAGSHLAMMAGYEWNNPGVADSIEFRPERLRVKAVVEIYGPVDLTTEYARNHETATSFIGRSWDEAPDLYREASPLTWLDAADPPTMISDNLVPASQARILRDKCRELGIEHEYYNLPLWPHTMDIILRVNEFSQQAMTAFFEKHLSWP